jgi:hypothetical protein
MPRRNRREGRPQVGGDLTLMFCGRCGCEVVRDLTRRGGQVVCRSCVALDARRQADRVPQ